MAIDFNVKDILHKIQVKFTHAFLPEAKKPYNLRTVHQPELDIHGIASKADVYNIGTSAKVIEEGLTAGMELIKYLVADGFKIKTPLFNLKVCVPGE
jgi:predicted alpha/beta-hydrolase family hydrolase